MKTDKELFKLFSSCPELLFEAANFEVNDTYKMTSITLKEFERRSDGFLKPTSEKSPVFFTEFQAYWDDTIYHRLVMEMSAFGVENPKSDIRGMLVFTHENLDLKTSPWYELTHSKKDVFRVVYLENFLKDLKKKDPNHPLIATFKPYQIKNQQTLRKKSRSWYKNITKSSLPEEVKDSFEAVFTRWMQERFPKLSYEEVTKMFVELTPLEETRSYKELVAIGEKKGEKKGEKRGEKRGEKIGEKIGSEKGVKKLIARLIAQKFGIKIQRVTPRLRPLRTKDIMELGESLLTMDSFEDANQWINVRKKQIKMA